MPSADQILSALHQIANQWQVLAVMWHLYFGVLVMGLMVGQRPSKRVGALLLGIPLFSVSILAWITANPFNGAIFALVGLALIALAWRLPNEAIQLAPTWGVAAGVLMFLFGWIYPHFLDTTSFLPYLYAAPTGLVPCPTLSIVIGLSLMVDGFHSRKWSLVLGATGLFYGLFGALRLGVTLDFFLLFGAILLIAEVFWVKHEARDPALAH